MYTGTLIADLFEAVKRAEEAAANPFSPPETKQAVLHQVEVDSRQYTEEEELKSE